MRCHFACMVWGEHHIDMYFRVGLPSQLMEGNIAGFPWLSDSVYEVYTFSADVPRIESHPLFGYLRSLLEVRIILLDGKVELGSKWGIVRYCHREQVRSADAADATLFFLCADQLWSAGSFRNAAARIEMGYSAVVCAGPRANADDITLEGSLAPLTGRDVVQLLIDHPHRETLTWSWDHPDYFQYGTYIYFPVEKSGIIAFCWIMHPLCVRAEVRGAAFHKVFDQDYLLNACPDVSSIHVVQDSDEICQVELSPAGMELPSQPYNPHRNPVSAMAWYAEACFNSHHRHFVNHPVQLQGQNPQSSEWALALRRGNSIIDAVHMWLSVPDATLLHLDPENLTRRINMRHWFNPSAISFDEKCLLDDAYARMALYAHRIPYQDRSP